MAGSNRKIFGLADCVLKHRGHSLCCQNLEMKHSASLILVWRIAEFEARQTNASTIEPNHLLLGLCKVVDLDLPAFVDKAAPDRDEVLEELLREVRRLRGVYLAAGLDAKTFRRKLRRVSGERRFALDDSERMRRSTASKQIFSQAEHFAQLVSHAVYPIHLLYSILHVDDGHRDDLLAELKVEKKCLVAYSKREILGKQIRSTFQSAKKTRWN
jgi:hypothetical protein